ncbi:MAG: hypothetical protein KC550_00680 [Nanoarchaeota archaeon]|nr:hypothetical protein [Nanoarchaeota archaeon]
MKKKDITNNLTNNSKNTNNSTNTNSNSGLALGLAIGGIIIPIFGFIFGFFMNLDLIIVGLFIPIIGFCMEIIALVLGIKARKKNKFDSRALATIISSILCILVLPILTIIALMFSFTDGGFIPNELELDNDLRGLVTESLASSDENKITIVFRYIGTSKMSMKADSGIIIDVLDYKYSSNFIENIDTNSNSGESEKVVFKNGQTGILSFTPVPELLNNDVVEGIINITYVEVKTGAEFHSKGQFRLGVN